MQLRHHFSRAPHINKLAAGLIYRARSYIVRELIHYPQPCTALSYFPLSIYRGDSFDCWKYLWNNFFLSRVLIFFFFYVFLQMIMAIGRIWDR